MTTLQINEVAPRDGFQSEERFIPTEQKIALIDALTATGIARIEATSFVSPKAIPNLGDAADVVNAIQRREGVDVTVLVPNLKGAERALACGVDRLGAHTLDAAPEPLHVAEREAEVDQLGQVGVDGVVLAQREERRGARARGGWRVVDGVLVLVGVLVLEHELDAAAGLDVHRVLVGRRRPASLYFDLHLESRCRRRLRHRSQGTVATRDFASVGTATDEVERPTFTAALHRGRWRASSHAWQSLRDGAAAGGATAPKRGTRVDACQSILL